VDERGAAFRSWACPRVLVEGRIPAKDAAPASVSFAAGAGEEEDASEAARTVRARLSVVSRADAPLSVRYRLLVPSGLVAEGAAATGAIDLGARGEAALDFAFRPTGPGALSTSVSAVLWAEAPDGTAWSEGARLPLAFEAAPDAEAAWRAPRRLPASVPAALAIEALACAAVRRRRVVRDGALQDRGARGGVRWEEALAVVAATAYLAWLLRAWLAFGPGLDLGGDTAAHHYLMDRIARTGRLVSWADGWWGGFPMFRFYFPLPYAAMAAAGKAVGHDVAFKLGSIAGVLALPAALWGAGRIARLPRPAPAMLAALALPLALDNTHNMWGANAYSTLAGMIANSWSFALFPVALALGVRDARRERVSCLSPFVFAALALSHFFTSILAGLALGGFALALAVAGRRRAFRALALEGAWAAGLVAWWALPLAATGAWCVAFGEQWDIRFLRQLPPMLAPAWIAAAAVAAAAARWSGARGGAPEKGAGGARDFALLHGLLLAFALLLFFFGRSVAEVFVNCRLWPFLVYAMLVGVALAWASVARGLRVPGIGAAAFLAFCAAFAWRTGGSEENPDWSRECHVPFWAEYNFRGPEALPLGDVFYRLAERVKGRPGLVAYDLHEGNEALGSTRCFEALPFVAPGTRILEGGIVNSALGSIAAYTVQGEVSDETAGWPLVVRPRSFDPASGLRHLELLGVRTFVARSRKVQAAFDADPGWERIGEEGPAGLWAVYGSTIAGEPDVRAWKRPLEVASRPLRQEEIAAWWACRGATEHPVVHLPHPTSSEADLDSWRDAPPPEPGWLDRVSDPVPFVERREDGSLAFFAIAPDRPHVVAASYFPDWVADGAEGPYPLSSGQMVVYPKSAGIVRLRHARLPSEILGRFLSGLAVAFLPLFLRRRLLRRARGAEGGEGGRT